MVGSRKLSPVDAALHVMPTIHTAGMEANASMEPLAVDLITV